MVPVVLAGLVASCLRHGQQSALDPAGPASAAISRLWNVMLVLAVVVYLIVLAALLVTARRRSKEEPDLEVRERSAHRAVTGGAIATGVILLGLLVYDLAVARSLAGGFDSESTLRIRLTGHQWWWEVDYVDPVPQNRVLLANEIHVPAGRTVSVELISHDVIHSFWAPNLGGKKDLIPGHPNQLLFRADRAGVYRAQCAEFCGAQHAKMALFVVVETPEQFVRWLERQRSPPLEPTDSLVAAGRTAFETKACSACHTIGSTAAHGRIGPNLSHVAGRLSLAAGSLDNSPGNLAGWIADPQTIKPGAQMPATALSPRELRALVAYIGTLR